jgi:hypothetical protein
MNMSYILPFYSLFSLLKVHGIERDDSVISKSCTFLVRWDWLFLGYDCLIFLLGVIIRGFSI